jgi:hypothetical protein
MTGPINAIDMARFRKLADLIEESGVGEIDVYVADARPGKQYVNIALKCHNLDTELVRRIFALPVADLLGTSSS